MKKINIQLVELKINIKLSLKIKDKIVEIKPNDKNLA